jgi:predicted Fe-Mo cluster-binding NifX family protein
MDILTNPKVGMHAYTYDVFEKCKIFELNYLEQLEMKNAQIIPNK